jgi:hypothetical protein
MKYYALILVLICTVVFILQQFLPITDPLALISSQVLSRPWTLITYMFLHASVSHILYNMVALGLFGFILENIIGSKRFLAIYFLSGIIAGLGTILFYTASIGASGAIFGVLGTLGIIRSRMVVFVSYVPMPMALAVILWAAGSVFGLFYPSDVAYAGHLFGLIPGLVAGLLLRKRFKEMPKKKKRKEEVDEEYLKEWENKYMK